VRIGLFEVPPDADVAFLADWDRERTEVARLLRALRADARHRYVELVPDGDDYALLYQHGTPDVEGGVVRVDLVAVPPGEDEAFLAAWERVHAVCAEQRGYLGTRLYRAAAPGGPRFVEVAHWSSPLMVARTLKLAALREAASFASEAALYQTVRGEPGRRTA
jgi:heme-degrading monooxygenase HmoA